MGVDLSKLVELKGIKLKELKGKKIAIDTYIMLYEFLETLPALTDSQGRTTSHLVGLLHRTTHLMLQGIKPCFVFDGPLLEVGEKFKRIENKPVGPRLTETITADVIESSQQLIKLLGLPLMQAPSEAEAQAAFMNKRGDVWAVASKDFDCLMFGAKRMIKNLTLAKRRRLPSGKFVFIGPSLIELRRVLKDLSINHDQLIVLALLIGTDFNPGGVKGIGPVEALRLIKKYGSRFNTLFKKVEWEFDFSWCEAFNLIKKIPVTNKYTLRWRKPKKEKIKGWLVAERDFSEAKVESALKSL